MKVLIDAACDIHYSSFYIYGLYKIYGRKNVRFSSNHFKSFKHNNHFLAFVIREKDRTIKVIIDFTDSRIINDAALIWSDIYGKINIDPTMKLDQKIVSIGPGFGIRIYSLMETLWYAVTNAVKSIDRIPNARKFFSDYKAQYKRPKLSDYKVINTSGNYVFFMASLWKDEKITNKYRSNFVRSSLSNKAIDFEGGFAPRTKNDIKGYEELTTTSRISMKDYLDKITLSVVAFNTPAVKDCHGWKFAEYLCLGKAIISTPLLRQMPKDITDGDQFLITSGDEGDITQKMNNIVSHPKLKQQLEHNSRLYYDTYLAPEKVILKLIDT